MSMSNMNSFKNRFLIGFLASCILSILYVLSRYIPLSGTAKFQWAFIILAAAILSIIPALLSALVKKNVLIIIFLSQALTFLIIISFSIYNRAN